MAVVKSRKGQIFALGDYRKVNRKLRAMKFSNESHHSPATFPVLPPGTGTSGGSLQLHLIPSPGRESLAERHWLCSYNDDCWLVVAGLERIILIPYRVQATIIITSSGGISNHHRRSEGTYRIYL